MNYIYLLLFLAALCFLDRNIIDWLFLQAKRLELAIEKFFFRIKLEFDILIIRYNKRKWLKTAKELLKDLEP